MCNAKTEILIVIVVITGMFTASRSQRTNATLLPKERGLIFTTYNLYTWRTSKVQLRHLPIFPGYENFSGIVPGVNFSNPNTHFKSIDIDHRKKCIYMYEYHLRSIVAGKYFSKDLDDIKFKYLHVGVSRGNVQIAVDWLSHTIYWSDSKFRWIVAAPGEIDKIDMDYYKIVIDTHLEYPDGLTIDPLEGLLFWSDNGKHPKIERSDLKGENRHTIISAHLQSPLTLEADIFDKRIYWIDSVSESIVSSTYDGSDVITILKIPNSNLYDLAIFREVVYVSDIRNGNVYTLNKTKGVHLGKQESSIINIFPELIYGLAVYSEEKQPLKEKDYCAEKKCDHFCISTKTGAECVCSEGFKLNENTGKCNETFKGYHKAIVVANKTHICLLDIRSFANASYEYDCRFTVMNQQLFTDFPLNYTRKTRQTLTPPSRSGTEGMSTEYTTEAYNTKQPMRTTTGPFFMFRRYRQTTSRTMFTRRAGPWTTRRPYTQKLTTTVSPKKETGKHIKLINLNMEKRIIFYASESNTIYRRPIDLPIENDMTEVIVKASGNISGLAYDAEDGDNLYWCEYDKGEVWVVNVATKASKNVIKDYNTFSRASDLIVISNHSMLAMITGNRYIKTVMMDGSNIKTLKQGSGYISGLAYGRDEKSLYYISMNTLYKISITSKDQEYVFYYVDNGAFKLVLYQNYLSWVHEKKYGDFFVTTFDLKTKKVRRNNVLGNTNMEIVDIKVLDQRLQSTNHTNPCLFEDGGCSQICITKYINDVMTPVCECRLGYFLGNDNKTCNSTVVTDNFIIAVDMSNNELLQISLDNDTIHAIRNTDDGQYEDVFVDMTTKKLYWTEMYNQKIYSANLNGTDQRENSDLGYKYYPRGMDMDLTTGNIYFTARYDNVIGVITPSLNTIMFKQGNTFNSLADIVVHPGKGLMYYTSAGYYLSPYIGRADMDGTNDVQLIKGKQVQEPSGLAIDFIKGHLYWSDSYYDIIQQCDLDGKNCITIVNKTGTYLDEEISDIVTDGVFLYYSAHKKDHIVRVDLRPPYNRAVVGQSLGLGNLGSIAFYNSRNMNKQAESSACKARGGRGDCSTICLPTPTGRSCTCEDGAWLKADGRTCNNVYQCDDLIQQDVNVSGLRKQDIDITFSRLCPRHLNDKCRYRCPTNFVPLYDTSLTCTNVGWDLAYKTLCEESRCSSTIPNGTIDPYCGREVGVACDYSCNSGFVKAVHKVVCTANGTFQLSDEDLCEYATCPSQIPNGEVASECSQRVGDECTFQCNKGYTATTSKRKMKCTSDRHWDIADVACTEQTCVGDIRYGKLSSDCKMTIGEKCDYTCYEGYTRTREKAICTTNGTFHIPENGLCSPYTCSDTIDNGEIDQSCSRTLGQACSYSCNKYFTPVVAEKTIICSIDGWSPTASVLCTESFCGKESLENGNVIGNCTTKVGEKCMVQCDNGYVHTRDEVVCLNDLNWHPKDVCQAFKCSDTIENGELDDDCAATVGTSCKYTCNNFFTVQTENNVIKCMSDGWSHRPSEICKESVCEDTIQHGEVTGTCSREIGDTCEYNCDVGYINTTIMAVCKNDKQWHPRNPCTIIKCPATISNGDISENCPRTVGARCNYKCNKDHSPNSLHPDVTCGGYGQWDVMDIICLESECKDSSLPNGRVNEDCAKNVGETCDVVCDQGYTNITSVVVCRNDYLWHPIPSCMPLTCKPYIQNGEIDGSCDLSIGSVCNFNCFDGYTPTNQLTSVTCLDSGRWNVTKNLCHGGTNVATVTSTQTGLPVTGVSLGIAFLLIVIIALIGSFIFLVRRQTRKLPIKRSNTSTVRGKNFEFENPGYLDNAEPASVQTTNVDIDDQMQPTTITNDTSIPEDDDAIPISENEPLPDVAQIELTNDTIVLTTESWLKERERNQSEKY